VEGEARGHGSQQCEAVESVGEGEGGMGAAGTALGGQRTGVHRAKVADTERVHGEFQREVTGRMPELALVSGCGGRKTVDGRVSAGFQPAAAAQRAGEFDAGRICPPGGGRRLPGGEREGTPQQNDALPATEKLIIFHLSVTRKWGAPSGVSARGWQNPLSGHVPG